MKKLNNELRLIETYKNLLSPKKQEYIIEYFFNDLSLKEIAIANNVSRAAVHQAINDGMQEMREFEEKLHLLAKQEKRIKFIKSKIDNSNIIKEYLDIEYEEN